MKEILLGAHMQEMEKPTEAGAGTAKSKHNNCTNFEHKEQRKKRKLGLYIVVNLSPRGPKGKVLKIERNRLSMRCQMDCQEGR